MCRMSALTFDAPPGIKADIMHEVMVRSSVEEMGQKDGWGVTDFDRVWRSAGYYLEDVPLWKKEINQSRFMMSHLRKASGGTGRTELDNHPYFFDVAGEVLTAMHNGYFDGASVKWTQGIPHTDSYQALLDLSQRMAARVTAGEQDILTVDVVTSWLNQYTDGSHYALILHWRDKLYAIRGKTRTLAALRVGDGYLIATSFAVVRLMKAYIDSIYGPDVLKTGEPVSIEDNMFVGFAYGQKIVNPFEVLPISHATRQYAGFVPNNYTPPKAQAVVVEGNVNANDGKPETGNTTDDGYIVAPSRVPPRQSRTETTTALVLVDQPIFTLRQRRQRWSQLAGKFSPLRRELALLWVSYILGFTNHDSAPNIAGCLSGVKPLDFELIENTVFPRDVRDPKKFIKPFSSIAMQQINWWNHMVKPESDVELHMSLFGYRWFWLDTAYNKDMTVLRWEKKMVESLLSLPEVSLERCLDMRKFQRAVRAAGV